MHTLKIENLSVKVDGKLILNDFNIEIKSGEIHAVMGPNGTGKSTLSKVIMGDPSYEVISGNILYDEIPINNLTTDERARLGIFLGMQVPPTVDGVTNADFLRTACRSKDGEKFKLMEFIKELTNNCKNLKMDEKMIHRAVNQGFSGGERKKNEILQMYMLKPNMILLDEIDSGLDVDSLKIVGNNVMDYYNNSDSAILLITHYQRLLDYIKPDFVHIMMNGKIIYSGDKTLVKQVEEKGYEEIFKLVELGELSE